jgi:long-chain fatty acid transport protein
MRRGGLLGGALCGAALCVLVSAPLHAAGFSIFEQGSRAMGMAGAFTAQADDPSLLFHNVGGLGFVEEQDFSAGFTWIHGLKAEFEGANPFPGEGYEAEQKALSEFPPHLYWVRPINDTWKFGLGIMTPFGLTTEWEDPGQFAGRYISTKAALQAFDIQPTLGWQVTPNFSVGVGAIARISTLELNRYIPAVNPFTLSVADVGRIKIEGDYSEGYGFTAGVLHRVNNSFSWGFNYRSKIEIDYEGDGRVTQILTGTPFDQVIPAVIPFNRDLPVETNIEFPDSASLGLLFALSPNLRLETDFNWTGWSSFDEVPITFTGGPGNALPSSVLPEEWEDVWNYRAGLRWTASPTSEWRLGYVFDETPQPEEGISPLLPDADRNGFTVGYGRTGPGFNYDLSVMYLIFDERTRDQSFQGEGPFFGTYNTEAVLVGVTLNF